MTFPDPQSDTTSCFPNKLTIGIVGFGNFGQFLGKRFASRGHRIIGVSRGDYAEAARAIGCEYVRQADILMDQKPDVVIFCTSIMSMHKVLTSFPIQRLEDVLVVDVLSVKQYPRDLLLKSLPSESSIVCTHPMFGPESGKHSWKGLPFVYDLVRISPKHKKVCKDFIDIWRVEDCDMVPMECAQHDTYAASTQFITHTTGRMLAQLNVCTTPINTRGYEDLLGVVDTTCKDSFDLFYGLYKYNPKARLELEKMESALKNIREQLEAAEHQEVENKKIRLENGKKPTLSELILENLAIRTNALL